jgi:aromatic ring hydroxylase
MPPSRGVQANVGEIIAWRNLFWGLSDAMVRDPKPWIGDYVLPNMDPGNAYQIIATMAYTRVKYLIEQTVASGLIYLNSHALDFKNPEIRPYLDQYLRGSASPSRSTLTAIESQSLQRSRLRTAHRVHR